MTPQQRLELAMARHRNGRFAEAELIYRQLLTDQPQNADLLHLLGLVLADADKVEAGLTLMRQAIAAHPAKPHYYYNLATILAKAGRTDEAVEASESAIRLDPNAAIAYYNLGVARDQQGRSDDAIAAYRKTLAIDPNYPRACLNLGLALARSGQIDQAISLYRSTLQCRPNDVWIANNLGSLYRDAGQLDRAVDAYRSALAMEPGNPITLNNLGVALKDRGEVDDAIAAFRRSLSFDSCSSEVHSNLIFTLFFSAEGDSTGVEAEQFRWNRQHAQPLRGHLKPHGNDRLPERQLTIGYVSPDLRDHVVGRAFWPVFEKHSRGQVRLICYAVGACDAFTERFRGRADLWRNAGSRSDEQLAAQIRADGVDILVDLALHTSDNRLPVFARKPAPIQVNWLGYPGTTGVETMDYRITDPFLDPHSQGERFAFEMPYRLPRCWCVYDPPVDSPEIGPVPSAREGRIVFGSFNNLCKVNHRVLDLWARVLRSVNQSQLLLLAKNGMHQDYIRDRLAKQGIDPQRISFLSYVPATVGKPIGDYLRRYQQVDIALDPFPYNGMTTTCDALWMGVPVVALVGKTPLGRASFSLMSNIGHPELAAHDEDDYVRLASELAAEPARLASLRATLRQRMIESPLLDAAGLARDLESAYRAMWRRWCCGPNGK